MLCLMMLLGVSPLVARELVHRAAGATDARFGELSAAPLKLAVLWQTEAGSVRGVSQMYYGYQWTGQPVIARWSTEIHDWYVETGDFTIEAGDSSANLPLKATVKVASTVELPRHYDTNSIFMDVMQDPKAMGIMKPFIDQLMAAFSPDPAEAVSEAAGEAISADMGAAMLNYMPLRGVLSFGGGKVTDEMMAEMLRKINE